MSNSNLNFIPKEKIELNNHAILHLYRLAPADMQSKPIVIICPGGGYAALTENETECVALKWNSRGCHAAILEYSILNEAENESIYPSVLIQAAESIILARKNAQNWMVDEQGIFLLGFSAGGNLAANYATHWQDDFLDMIEPIKHLRQINGVILCYPLLDWFTNEKKMREIIRQSASHHLNAAEEAMWNRLAKIFDDCAMAVFRTVTPTDDMLKDASPIYHITSQMPPVFIWHTLSDEVVLAESTLRFGTELVHHNVSCELHLYDHGGHGLSLADCTSATKPEYIDQRIASWFELAVSWVNAHKMNGVNYEKN